MANNKNLSQAKKAKKDEFYTQLVDIENELRHYKNFFIGKVVFCNCDDPYESNFVKYFAMNFNVLGLKKLIATCYATSSVMYTQLDLFGNEIEVGAAIGGKKPYKIEITGVKDENGDGSIDLEDFETMLKNNPPKLLQGDGDFRSAECVELLKQADVVVTNPPFSLFREYVAQLIEFDKHFLILGRTSVITYKDFFPLIKENKVWVGNGFNMSMIYNTPYPNLRDANKKFVVAHGYDPNDGFVTVPAVCWYTNIDFPKRHEMLILYKHYTPEEYPKYDNYDAIEVSKTADIPCDYSGVMGVPVTFMEKYNPKQFEIIGCAEYTGKYGSDDIGVSRIGEEWIAKYREQGGKGHYTANMTSLVYYDTTGKACAPFKRILVRRKKV